MTNPIIAELEYLELKYHGLEDPAPDRPYTYMYPPPDGRPWQNASYRRVPVAIHDARPDAGALSLDRQGYILRHAPSAVRDFLDKDEVVRRYYPEVAELALACTGASQAFVFDHMVRKRQPGAPQAFGRVEGHRPGAAGRVHCDFTPTSARRRLALEMEAELESALESAPRGKAAAVQRYSVVNLWRSIRHPVLDAPLAVCDAASVAPGDLVASDIFYQERRGEIYQAVHHPRHRWSYFPAMSRDEVLLFKQFDSSAVQLAKYTPHAAFEHPEAPADAPLRESIEIRCLLIYQT